MDSTEDPPHKFHFKEKDVPKLVFQCCRPDNIAQAMTDSNSATKMFEIFEEALKKKSMEPLLEELNRKVDTINRDISLSPTTSSADKNSAGDLETDELELLTFAEVLSDADYALPDSLERKRKEICANRRIPPTKKDDPEGRVNKFFVYSLNKTLVEICEKLSAEEVFAVKNFIIQRSEEVDTDEQMGAIRETEEEMVKAISVIESIQSLQQPPALKDVAFYYMILFMFKSKLLNNIHTEMLWKYLKGAASNLGGRKHIEKAVEQIKNYQLGSSPPGLCLIFAMNKERDGNKVDVEDVKNYFENMLKYDVIYKENPTVYDVTTTIEELGGSRYKFYDSLVVWFMAFGDVAYLEVDGGKIHRRRDLIEPLVTIDWLEAKPKLFFIQAGADLPDEQYEHPEKKPRIELEMHDSPDIDYSSVSNFADTIVCHATMWYQPAVRGRTGSLFIKTILQVLEKKGGRVSLDNALRETCLRMNSIRFRSQNSDQTWRQTPYYESSLQKKFIFPANQNSF